MKDTVIRKWADGEQEVCELLERRGQDLMIVEVEGEREYWDRDGRLWWCKEHRVAEHFEVIETRSGDITWPEEVRVDWPERDED